MKTFTILALLGALLAPGCNAPRQVNNHWTASSVIPRAMRQATGYDQDLDGSWLDYQWEQKSQIHQTLTRHFLNWNAENPFQQENPRWDAPRPVNSPFSNPFYYIHLDLGVSSVLGTLSGWQGVKEFAAGLKPSELAHGWGESAQIVSSSFLYGFIGPDGLYHTTFNEESWEKNYRRKNK